MMSEEITRKLFEALHQLVADWDSVPESEFVPDEINVNEHWDAARDAIAAFQARKLRVMFEKMRER